MNQAYDENGMQDSLVGWHGCMEKDQVTLMTQAVSNKFKLHYTLPILLNQGCLSWELKEC